MSGAPSWAFGIAHDDYVGGNIPAKVAQANENVLTIAQIETSGGVENVDAIASVDGIDVLFLGHFDLTNFLKAEKAAGRNVVRRHRASTAGARPGA